MIGLDSLSIVIGVAIGVVAALLVRAMLDLYPAVRDLPPATDRQIRRAQRAARADLARARGRR